MIETLRSEFALLNKKERKLILKGVTYRWSQYFKDACIGRIIRVSCLYDIRGSNVEFCTYVGLVFKFENVLIRLVSKDAKVAAYFMYVANGRFYARDSEVI